MKKLLSLLTLLIPFLAFGQTSVTLQNKVMSPSADSVGFTFVGKTPGAISWYNTNAQNYKQTATVDIRRFGAVADGATDNTTAFNNALAWQSSSATNRTLLIPEGTFVLNGSRQGANTVLLRLYSNTRVIGMGEKSIIKIADNYTAGGDYSIFGPLDTETTDNVYLSNFTIEGNGLNNLVAGSTGGNIRRVYNIVVKQGTNINIDHINFQNSPGRNVIVLGDNSTGYHVKNIRITYCNFHNVGGGISGNELQNDHSTIYSQADGGFIDHNRFWNDAIVNPASVANHVVTALEIHGSNQIVSYNTVDKYTHGGNIVAAVDNSANNSFINNQFTNLTKLGFSLWSLSPYHVSNCTIRGNKISMYGQLGTEIGGIFQSTQTSNTTSQFTNLKIESNYISSDDVTARAAVWQGIDLCAVDGADIINNDVVNIQGAGIQLTGAVAALDINNVNIVNNRIQNVGFNTFASVLFGIYVNNAGTNNFTAIYIDQNNINKSAYSTTGMRGIRVAGTGWIAGVYIGGDNYFHYINDPTTFISVTATNTSRITTGPRMNSGVSTADPTTGNWVAGYDKIENTDKFSGAYSNKDITVTGGAFSATWAASTAYAAHTWVALSTNKIIEYTVAGTSGGTEPVPGALGSSGTDGTATYIYRAGQKAVFRNVGFGSNAVAIDQTFKTVTTDNTGQNKFLMNEGGVLRAALGLSTDGNKIQFSRYNSSAVFQGSTPYIDNVTGFYYFGSSQLYGFGSGTPEGSITASPGSLYSDVSTTGKLYLKGSGSATNTGWLQLSTTTGTVTGGTINWPGTLYTTPTTGTVSSGTLTFAPALATQAANTHLLGPSSGSAAAPTFRAPVAADFGSGTANTTTYLRGDLTWQTISGGGSGTVTNVATGTGLTGGPITTTGTISADTTVLRTVANSYSLSGMQTKLNGYAKLQTGTPSAQTGAIDVTGSIIGGADISTSTGIFSTGLYSPAPTYSSGTFKVAVINSTGSNHLEGIATTGTGNVVLAASPALTGSPTAPTQSTYDNSTNLATTAYADKNTIIVSTTTGIDAKTTGFTTLYTVPTGKIFVCTQVYLYATTATAITVGPSFDLGDNVGGTGSILNTTTTGITTTTKVYRGAPIGLYGIVTAGNTVRLNITTGATGTTETLTAVLEGFLK